MPYEGKKATTCDLVSSEVKGIRESESREGTGIIRRCQKAGGRREDPLHRSHYCPRRITGILRLGENGRKRSLRTYYPASNRFTRKKRCFCFGKGCADGKGFAPSISNQRHASVGERPRKRKGHEAEREALDLGRTKVWSRHNWRGPTGRRGGPDGQNRKMGLCFRLFKSKWLRGGFYKLA